MAVRVGAAGSLATILTVTSAMSSPPFVLLTFTNILYGRPITKELPMTLISPTLAAKPA